MNNKLLERINKFNYLGYSVSITQCGAESEGKLANEGLLID